MTLLEPQETGGNNCTPVTEICGNNLDDDCDGQIDEDCNISNGSCPCNFNPSALSAYYQNISNTINNFSPCGGASITNSYGQFTYIENSPADGVSGSAYYLYSDQLTIGVNSGNANVGMFLGAQISFIPLTVCEPEDWWCYPQPAAFSCSGPDTNGSGSGVGACPVEDRNQFLADIIANVQSEYLTTDDGYTVEQLRDMYNDCYNTIIQNKTFIESTVLP